MHKVKTGLQNMYMKCTCTLPRVSVMKERLSHLCICCCVQVKFLSIATTVRSAPMVSFKGYQVDHCSHPTLTSVDLVIVQGKESSSEDLAVTMV